MKATVTVGGLVLETECKECEGTGYDFKLGDDDQCVECDGKGQVLTRDGAKLLALVRKWM